MKLTGWLAARLGPRPIRVVGAPPEPRPPEPRAAEKGRVAA